MDRITKKSQYPIDEKPAVTGATITGEPTSINPNHQSKFKVNDRVVVKSVKDEVFNGTVKWVGTTRVRNESDRYSSVIAAVGVDVVSQISVAIVRMITVVHFIY